MSNERRYELDDPIALDLLDAMKTVKAAHGKPTEDLTSEEKVALRFLQGYKRLEVVGESKMRGPYLLVVSHDR